MGLLDKNPLLLVTLILLVIVAIFGVLIAVTSVYIGVALGRYIGFTYGLYGIPGTLLGVVTVLAVLALLVVAKNKSKKKKHMICFVLLLGLLALLQLAFGLGFIAHDYEQRGVEYEGVKYENNVAMYQVSMREVFRTKLAHESYSTLDLRAMPTQVTLDALQKDFQCCGLSGPSDYGALRGCTVLKSCCRTYVEVWGVPFCDVYDRGCVGPFYDWFTGVLVNFGVLLFVASLFTIASTVCTAVLVANGS